MAAGNLQCAVDEFEGERVLRPYVPPPVRYEKRSRLIRAVLIIGQQSSRGSEVALERATAEWHALTVGDRAAPPVLAFSKIK